MGTVPQLTPAQLASERDSVRVVDVREPAEVATGRIAGAVNIPLGQLAGRLGELAADAPIVTVCQSGGRSRRGAAALAAASYTVSNLDGGMNAWTGDGRPVERH